MIKPLSKSNQFKVYILVAFSCLSQMTIAQTWVDTLDSYARESYLPPSRYMWTWQDAALLNTMVKQYDLAPASHKQIYLDYVKKSMKHTMWLANGRTPNDVASALGLAFLYRVTKDEKYKLKAEKIYAQYLKVKRTSEGGVSHLSGHIELWDDTMFMIGEFLLDMYQATGDEKYLEEFAKQMKIHHDKLQDKEWGLWDHGWDSDNKDHCYICGQLHWPDKSTRRSTEIWGRGNGWITVTLSDALEVIPRSNAHWKEMATYLKEMIQHLPELQDKATGHWYQLPVRNKEPKNFIESSCTAMFAYGISGAIRQGIVSDPSFKKSIELAYYGLRKHSLVLKGDKYLITQNICTATCIGDKDYYLKRPVQKGKPYGIGMFIQFGLHYELDNNIRTR